jgi:hypothetical protein
MEDDPVKSVQKVIAMSDQDFAKWLDKVVSTGLKIGR